MRVAWLITTLVLVSSACVSTRDGVQVSAEYNTITYEEIEQAMQRRPLQNAYELIEFLRPKYLVPRIQNTVNQGAIRKAPVVYVNNVRFGSVDELYNISIGQIVEIHYLKSNEATHRFGIGHEGGAIIISTR